MKGFGVEFVKAAEAVKSGCYWNVGLVGEFFEEDWPIRVAHYTLTGVYYWLLGHVY